MIAVLLFIIGIIFVFFLISPNDHLQDSAQTEMPANLQKMQIGYIIVRNICEKIAEPGRDSLIRQKTPPRGTGIVHNSKVLGKGDLRLARSAGDIHEFPAIHNPLQFRSGGIKMVSRKGPQNKAFQTAFTLNKPQGVAMLRHGPLTKDLAGNDKRSTHLRQQLFNFPEHVDPAVDAGIHAAAMTVGRMLDHPDVIHTFVDDVNRHIKLFGNFPGLELATRLLWRTVAKNAGKMNSRYVDSLIDHQPDSQGAVQAAGEKRYSFTIQRDIQWDTLVRRFLVFIID